MISVLPLSWLTSVISAFSGETTPSATFMYGLAKSTFSLRSSVTVKLASVMSTLLDVSTSTRAAGSTDVYLTFTPRSLARRSAKTMS